MRRTLGQPPYYTMLGMGAMVPYNSGGGGGKGSKGAKIGKAATAAAAAATMQQASVWRPRSKRSSAGDQASGSAAQDTDSRLLGQRGHAASSTSARRRRLFNVSGHAARSA